VETGSDRGIVEGDGGSPSSQLQAIVDEASRVLERPIAIDDRHLRLLAYTQHAEDEVDRYRLMSIMKQPLPAEVFEWLDRHGAWSSEGPLRIPSSDRLEFDARVGAPIRCQDHHLGWVWCTDRDQTMTDGDLERMAAFADEAALVLYREMLLLDLDRSRERELLRDIMSPDEGIRREAAWQLAELDLFTAGGRVVVLVIPLDHGDDDRSPEDARIAVEALLMRVRRHLAPKHGLHLVRPGHALVLMSLADPGIRASGVPVLAERIRQEIVTSLPAREDGQRQIVAVGGVARGLTHAVKSYEQALRAADVAATVSTFGEVVCWDDLGIYQMLAQIPVDVLGANALHPGLGRLLEDPRSRDLLATLERYLDYAGDVQETAASLYLHRTTLYHRLRRIESVAQVDLHNGDDRLALHLSLKLARLQGMSWPTAAGETPGSGPPDRH
jgi:sugar diacid utilization regulator